MKRGQIQISFGMIFSIIMIIATIAISFYVITYFIKIGRCSEISLFYDDLNKRVDKAWASPITREVYTSNLPSGIESVCFGSLLTVPVNYGKEYDVLKKYRNQKANVFLYPLTKSCSNSAPFYYIKNAEIDGFFCIEVISGKVSINIKKDSTDALVKIEK
jgi:hypothetical protein